MMFCYCMVQEGKIPPDEIRSLEEGLERIVGDHLASEVKLTWIVVREGDGWLAGEPSNNSLVLLTTPDIEQEARVELLAAIRDLWTDCTSWTAHDVMISAPPLSALAS